MKTTASIALVGDYSPDVIAHRAIPRALELARTATGLDVAWQWISTRDLREPARDLTGFGAVWVAPRSPYENTPGVLDAIRWARETKTPIIGSCGGFQHMLIEFARNVAGLPRADHAETNPSGDTLVVSRLSCPLVEQSGTVQLTPGSRLRAIYGRDSAEEGYHCSYGVAPGYRFTLEQAGLHFTAHDDTGEIRAAELSESFHPFFIGTLFQSERAALRGELPPLARALVETLG